MSPEKQRIAIARICHPDLANVPIEYWYTQNDDYEKDYVWIHRDKKYPHNIRAERVPDYVNDLNAIHEAEMTLEECELGSEITPYLALLQELCGPVNCAFAKADKRAEAFLKIRGGWRE